MIRIELSEPLAAVPAGFTVQAPPRIAIDLPGVTNALGKSSVEINQGNLRSVSVAQAGERTRLVLNLKAPAGYRAQIDGKVLIVVARQHRAAPTLGAARAGAADALRRQPRTAPSCRCATSTSGAAPTAPAASSSSCRTTRSASTSASRARAWSSSSCARACPTACAAASTSPTSARRCRASPRPRAATACAWWSSRAAPGSTAPTRATTSSCSRCGRRRSTRTSSSQGAGYAGEKLSLNFQNIEVRALLQVIADFTNFNVVTSDTVTGNVTLRLKDVPWDQALDIILQAKNLGLRKSGNVILIAPKDELERQGEDRARGQAADRRARAAAHAVVPAELRQGAGHRQRA